MANFIYKKTKEALLNGDIKVLDNELKVLLLNNNYTPNQNTDAFVSDIIPNSIVSRSNAITNISSTLGILDANDVKIDPFDGVSFKAIALYQSTGLDATSRLVFYIDTAPGLPFNGSNLINTVTISWSDEPGKILFL